MYMHIYTVAAFSVVVDLIPNHQSTWTRLKLASMWIAQKCPCERILCINISIRIEICEQAFSV